MSKRTEPLIRHQSAFISQHKGDGGKRDEYSMFEWRRSWEGWLMSVMERCIMEGALVAGYRTRQRRAVDGLHGVLRWSRGAAGTER